MNKKFNIHSVKTVALGMGILVAIVMTLAAVIVSNIEFGGMLHRTFDDYLYDMAGTSGEIAQTLYKEFDGEIPQAKFEEYFSDIKIEQLPSSYAMVVDSSNGVIMYHHTAGKIGEVTENEAILKIVDALKSNSLSNKHDMTSYKIGGVEKLAAYSVVADNAIIVCVAADKTDISAAINEVLIMFIIIATAIAVVLSIIVFVVLSIMMNPLTEVTAVVDQLGHFDLTDDPKQTEKLCSSKNEIGQIARAVRDLRTALRTTVSTLIDNSGKLNGYSTELSNNSESVTEYIGSIDSACSDIADGATAQAHSTEEATSKAINMGSLIDSSISAVDSLKGVSEIVKEATYSAGDKLSDVMISNQKVTDVTEEIRLSIMETSESAEKIQAAADAITSIASQTNLLSLNASIEAARAGEAGRGFAVVASEIQKLAEESNKSAVEIRDIIRELIDNSSKSVEDIQEAKGITEEQTVKLNDAISEFTRAKEGLNQSLVEIDKVKASTAELDSSKNEVIDIIQSLAAISEENAASTEETAASVTQAKAVIDEVAERALRVSDASNDLSSDAMKWTL